MLELLKALSPSDLIMALFAIIQGLVLYIGKAKFSEIRNAADVAKSAMDISLSVQVECKECKKNTERRLEEGQREFYSLRSDISGLRDALVPIGKDISYVKGFLDRAKEDFKQ